MEWYEILGWGVVVVAGVLFILRVTGVIG